MKRGVPISNNNVFIISLADPNSCNMKRGVPISNNNVFIISLADPNSWKSTHLLSFV